jgi:hypothetical protein
MKHIKKFNETKKDEKVEDQEVLFNAEVLVDKDDKPSFTTDVQEDQEKVKKEFDKLRKVKKFENFTIEVEVEVKPEDEKQTLLGGPESSHTAHDNHMRNQVEQEQGCGCGCQDCTCGTEEEVEETNPETDVKVMNMADFMNSLGQ